MQLTQHLTNLEKDNEAVTLSKVMYLETQFERTSATTA